MSSSFLEPEEQPRDGEGGGGDGEGGGGEGEGGGGEGGGGANGGGGEGGGEETMHEPSSEVATLSKLLASGAMQPGTTKIHVSSAATLASGA